MYNGFLKLFPVLRGVFLRSFSTSFRPSSFSSSSLVTSRTCRSSLTDSSSAWILSLVSSIMASFADRADDSANSSSLATCTLSFKPDHLPCSSSMSKAVRAISTCSSSFFFLSSLWRLMPGFSAVQPDLQARGEYLPPCLSYPASQTVCFPLFLSCFIFQHAGRFFKNTAAVFRFVAENLFDFPWLIIENASFPSPESINKSMMSFKRHC